MPVPRRRRGDLGTAQTELESAPTWVALGKPERRNPRADRHCERQSSPDAVVSPEEFCRQPAGFVTSVATPSREPNVSQRALFVSVGALLLSVVAMTTMFIFVYSHGERALAVPAVQRSAAALAAAQPLPEAAPAPTRELPPLPDTQQLAETQARCAEPRSPLAPASVIERSPSSAEPEIEIHALHGIEGTPGGFSGQALHGALPCE